MRSQRLQRFVPAGLALLCVVPVTAGGVRLASLASGVVTPENARFFDSPVPVVVHVVGASLFLLLGIGQLHPGLRRRSPAWHRRAGRGIVAAGLAAALSGLWMSVFYALPAHDNDLLLAFRLLAGTGMAASLVLAVVAVRRRDIAAHRAWMLRGYALGLGAGTQVLTILPWALLVGPPAGTVRAVLMGLGWVVNLAVAEAVVRAPRRRVVRQPRAAMAVNTGAQ
ncbi:DUF2306 domain-containing protein [Kineosporia sp. R_H_3]|uniref:DUF2306 domain-containing protein n=1 Tax=Kineosporia sp. R_H_3 TaxID=1961848 RepID=UPI000B4BD301|nr:DUF2306 domain-containing protein [Kineosporia sp. R_H_3]